MLGYARRPEWDGNSGGDYDQRDRNAKRGPFTDPERALSTARHHSTAGWRTSAAAFLALCGVMGAEQALSFLFNASVSEPDWQTFGLWALILMPFAVINVYVSAFVIRFFGRLMGSGAGRDRIRTVLAWGAAPLLWAGLLSALLFVLKGWLGNDLVVQSGAALLGGAGLCSFLVTVAMLKEVQKLSWARAFAGYAAALLLTVLIVALPIRTFLWQPFNIPSGASAPTLIVGDYLFVSKSSYGYSRYSFPFGLGLLSGRIFFSQPDRGDVIVFKKPADNSTDYIKRLVGLPGDRIQMINGVLNINGVPVKRERVEDKIEDTNCGLHAPVHIYRETLPNGRSHLIQKLSETCPLERTAAGDDTEVFIVPPKHYFMMGDNRDNSADSRFSTAGVGYVPEENLVGRAEVIFMSVSEDGRSRAERLLTRVR